MPCRTLLRSGALDEGHVERGEDQDDPDVHQEPTEEVVAEEREVYSHHYGDHNEYVQRGKAFGSHARILRICEGTSVQSEAMVQGKGDAAAQRGERGLGTSGPAVALTRLGIVDQ